LFLYYENYHLLLIIPCTLKMYDKIFTGWPKKVSNYQIIKQEMIKHYNPYIRRY